MSSVTYSVIALGVTHRWRLYNVADRCRFVFEQRPPVLSAVVTLSWSGCSAKRHQNCSTEQLSTQLCRRSNRTHRWAPHRSRTHRRSLYSAAIWTFSKHRKDEYILRKMFINCLHYLFKLSLLPDIEPRCYPKYMFNLI